MKNMNHTKCDLVLDRIKSNAERFGSKVAVSFIESGLAGGKLSKQLTYIQLEQETTALAERILGTDGLKQGDWYVTLLETLGML